MQLQSGAEHSGNVIYVAWELNVAVANEATVKHVNYILEMSQNDEYFNRRGVTKCSCGCTLMFYLQPFFM